MPLNDGEYQKLTKEEIQERLENSLEEKLDTNAQAGELVTKQLAAEAETLANNQEQALERVHQAAYLADATGPELDKVVDIIGLSRMEATASTGVVRLWRDTPPTANYTIPNGATVQTSGSDPIQFSLTQQDTLRYIDGWEDNDLANWEGDTADFSVSETSELSGNYALQVPATAGVSIYTGLTSLRVGTTFNLDLKPTTGAVTAFKFGRQDASNYFECIIDEAAQDFKLRLVEDGGEAALSNNNSATIPADVSSHLEIEWGLYGDTTAILYETSNRDVEVSSVTLEESNDWESGSFAIESNDGNATMLVDELATRAVHLNIEAEDTGTETNIGPNTITTMGTSVTGVENVTNPVATGDPSESNTNGTPLVIGEKAESDEELRDRAFNSTSIGGAATVNALRTELHRVDGVKALTLNRNREETEVDGLPPHSFEAIVYGGSDEAVAEAIFNTASIDSHDVGGIHGVGTSYSIQSSVTKDTQTINFSRPNLLNLDITLDLIVDDTYVGDAEIQSIVTRYIGGTGIDGNFINGLDVGEDIYEAILKRKVVGPDKTGVWEVNNLVIDKDGDGTDDTTTTSSGAEILSVADNEVAITDSRDGSITITKTQK